MTAEITNTAAKSTAAVLNFVYEESLSVKFLFPSKYPEKSKPVRSTKNTSVGRQCKLKSTRACVSRPKRAVKTANAVNNLSLSVVFLMTVINRLTRIKLEFLLQFQAPPVFAGIHYGHDGQPG